MKSRVLVLAALAASLGLSLPSKAARLQSHEGTAIQTQLLAQLNWISLVRQDEEFKAEMPHPITPEEGPRLRMGSITRSLFTSEPDDTSTFSIDYRLLNGRSDEAILARAADEALKLALQKRRKTHLLDKVKKISHPGTLFPIPGREVREEGLEGVWVLRVYADIGIQIYTIEARSSQENVDKFLNSFTLNPR
ncbi:MAG TPA: hypothetical protein V6D28_31375 [Leptolyngbyaceae cyanobacterium]